MRGKGGKGVFSKEGGKDPPTLHRRKNWVVARGISSPRRKGNHGYKKER